MTTRAGHKHPTDVVTRWHVFLIFVTVQVVGLLLLGALDILNVRGNSLVLDTPNSLLVLHPGSCLLGAAALLGWDLLNAVLIVRLFRRAGLG